ncbi:MAG: hypothetical protein AMK73_04275 [Planctomycetes bacterium SM23_32]|nr:MAG: hypothetical protein AMK73_04275 [Planctomycetes bacterium SM23_32]
MGTAVRLTIIGAGSAVFSMNLVRDVCLAEGLGGSTVTLMDVDEGRLDIIHELARRYADEVGADLNVEKTLEREAALRDADFVVNTALPGGHDRAERERAMTEERGYYRGLGHATVQRCLDLMMAVARDVERLCPAAWLIQVGNPVFEGCTLLTRQTGAKVLGLCHGHYGYREIADVLGLDREGVAFEAPGFNHCIWMTHFRYKGRDAYPLIDRWIEEESEDYWRTYQPHFAQTQMSPAAVHMYRFYGLMPIGDASRALWSDVWWYHLSEETKRRWWGPVGGFDSTEGWGRYLNGLEGRLAHIHRIAESPDARVSDEFPPRPSGEQVVPIIDALVNDRPGHFQVNVPNNGALAGVRDDVVVEVPAVIDGRGIRPLCVGRLPELIMLGVMWPRWLQMERTLAAYTTGDRRYLTQALLHDHRTGTWEQAEEALEALMG